MSKSSQSLIIRCHRELYSRFLACIALISLTGGFAQAATADDTASVKAVIAALQENWNRGDMTGYLALYRQDDTLRLTFGNSIVEGWSALNALFRQSYPDPERMGRFTVDRVDAQLLNSDTALAFGNFTHVFPHETIKGGFSHALVRDASGAWVIVHERTSRGAVIETD